LPGYDYSQAGAYFITICTYNRQLLYGEIHDCEIHLNSVGMMVEKTWSEIPDHFLNVKLGEFVVMPNHIHGIIEIILPDVEARHAVPLHEETFEAFGKPVPGSIPTIIRSFKSAASKRYHELIHNDTSHLWQRNYYEHVIRDEIDYQAIHDYIMTNPLNWEKDEENQISKL